MWQHTRKLARFVILSLVPLCALCCPGAGQTSAPTELLFSLNGEQVSKIELELVSPSPPNPNLEALSSQFGGKILVYRAFIMEAGKKVYLVKEAASQSELIVLDTKPASPPKEPFLLALIPPSSAEVLPTKFPFRPKGYPSQTTAIRWDRVAFSVSLKSGSGEYESGLAYLPSFPYAIALVCVPQCVQQQLGFVLKALGSPTARQVDPPKPPQTVNQNLPRVMKILILDEQGRPKKTDSIQAHTTARCNDFGKAPGGPLSDVQVNSASEQVCLVFTLKQPIIKGKPETRCFMVSWKETFQLPEKVLVADSKAASCPTSKPGKVNVRVHGRSGQLIDTVKLSDVISMAGGVSVDGKPVGPNGQVDIPAEVFESGPVAADKLVMKFGRADRYEVKGNLKVVDGSVVDVDLHELFFRLGQLKFVTQNSAGIFENTCEPLLANVETIPPEMLDGLKEKHRDARDAFENGLMKLLVRPNQHYAVSDKFASTPVNAANGIVVTITFKKGARCWPEGGSIPISADEFTKLQIKTVRQADPHLLGIFTQNRQYLDALNSNDGGFSATRAANFWGGAARLFNRLSKPDGRQYEAGRAHIMQDAGKIEWVEAFSPSSDNEAQGFGDELNKQLAKLPGERRVFDFKLGLDEKIAELLNVPGAAKTLNAHVLVVGPRLNNDDRREEENTCRVLHRGSQASLAEKLKQKGVKVIFVEIGKVPAVRAEQGEKQLLIPLDPRNDIEVSQCDLSSSAWQGVAKLYLMDPGALVPGKPERNFDAIAADAKAFLDKP